MALAANNPASDTFGSHLTMARVAERFGATEEDIAQVEDALESVGVSGTFHPSGGLMEAELTVAQAEELLGVSMLEGTDGDGRTFVRPSGEPVVPDKLAPAVTEVAGLARTVAASDQEPVGESSTTTAAAPPLDADSCTAARSALSALHGRYGISSLHDAGIKGTGAKVAVASLDLPDPTSTGLWSACLGIDAPPVIAVAADSTFGSAPDAEIDLDMATLMAALPGAGGFEVVVFDRYGWVGAPIATVLAGQDLPDAMSTSVGFCESDLAEDAVALGEWLFATAAAVGVTVVASAGDDGSTACSPSSADAAVQYPASSAWVTSVGGTQVGADGSEVVWSDEGAMLAGGGGSSGLIGIPRWQADGGVEGDRRSVPDLAALAAPGSWPPIPVCSDGSCEWLPVGGTSAATPLVAAGLLLTRQILESSGDTASGMWTPGFYDGSAPLALTDVTEGSNDLSDLGCCSATEGFDRASGLGTPRFAP